MISGLNVKLELTRREFLLGNQNSGDRNESLSKWVEDIENQKTKGYVQERIIKQMDWYRTKSMVYKIKYQRWTTCSIILSGIIPVVSILADGRIGIKLLIAALGSMVTGISAYLNLHNYKDLWGKYRFNREWLLSILYLYINQTGVFKKELSQESRDEMLIQMCEKCFQQEINDWKSLNE